MCVQMIDSFDQLGSDRTHSIDDDVVLLSFKLSRFEPICPPAVS